MFLKITLFTAIVFIFSCNNKIDKFFIQDVETQTSKIPKRLSVLKRANYQPYSDYWNYANIKKIKVNFHFMRNGNGEGGFDRKVANEIAFEVLEMANNTVTHPKKMNLPVGNDTDVFPVKIEYVLTPTDWIENDNGIYLHDDDELYYMIGQGKNRNNYSKAIFNKYCIQKDTVLNVFVQSHHLDSLAKPTYRAVTRGTAFSNWVKCSSWYFNYNDTVMIDGVVHRPRQYIHFRQFNHEIGHTLGLAHTWASNDGCDDTPKNPNCWGYADNEKCSTPSNNVMDYNNTRSAYTPCQIGIIHHNLAHNRTKKKLVLKNWCALDTTSNIIISDTIHWTANLNLVKNIEILNEAVLIVDSHITLPKGAKILVHPMGKLILSSGSISNDCGEEWEGIQIMKTRKNIGKVEYLKGRIPFSLKHVKNHVNFIQPELISF